MTATTLFELDDQLRAEHTALVLVDVQHDFVHPDGWVARQQMPGYLDSAGVPEALERLAGLLAAARSADVLRVFLQNTNDARYLSGPVRAQYRRLSGDPEPACTLEGTWGAAIDDAVAPEPSDREYVVAKHRYSGFAGTDLAMILRTHQVRTVVMTGFATSGCVESTARDALFADYYVVTAADCCGDYDPARHEATLRKLDLSFGYVTDAARIEKVWSSG